VNSDKITGPTITTVPFRIRIDSQQSVQAALTAVQDQSTTMVPFSQAGLQHIRKLSEEAAAACDFQSHLIVQSPRIPLGQTIMTELRDSRDSYEMFSSYALVMICTPASDDELSVSINFDPDIMDGEGVQRLVQQFEHILRQIRQDPNQNIGDLQMCSPQDIRQLEIWNAHLPAESDECLHELVLEHCAAQPLALAVCSWVSR
jgi:non-ribosomal peptide synthetase component F